MEDTVFLSSLRVGDVFTFPRRLGFYVKVIGGHVYCRDYELVRWPIPGRDDCEDPEVVPWPELNSKSWNLS